MWVTIYCVTSLLTQSHTDHLSAHPVCPRRSRTAGISRGQRMASPEILVPSPVLGRSMAFRGTIKALLPRPDPPGPVTPGPSVTSCAFGQGWRTGGDTATTAGSAAIPSPEGLEHPCPGHRLATQGPLHVGEGARGAL